ncbi:MAG: outer membrane lipoprotein carrier protein LolA [Bacteroidia bacterium]|nr:outer membrane lipoprotein carrier protein LolA [Bacteroidia bacterium]
MKQIFLLSILMFVVTFYAKSQQTTNMYDTKAKEILDQTSAKIKSYTSVKLAFSYTIDNQQNNTSDTHDGEFLIKGNKYRINLMSSIVYNNGTTQWTLLADADEVQITEPDAASDNILTPANIFTFYEKEIKYKYNGEKQENGKTVYEIELFPEQPKEKKYTRVKLNIEKTTYHIASIKYFGKDGIDYTIIAKTFTPNVQAGDADFVFDAKAHPEIEVIDLRDAKQ